MYGPKTPFSDDVHARKYRGEGEGFRDAMGRIAGALKDDDAHFQELREILLDMRFMPAGRVQTAMGASKSVTAYNCFVSGTIEDSFVHGEGSIMQRATEAATTMRMGGGIGYDFSTLRPRGSLIRKLNSRSNGPLAFMPVFDAICLATASAGHRRGAQMGVLRVDHPDIEEFVHAKNNSDRLTGFNMSVAVTDEFMNAVRAGGGFALRFAGEIYKHVDAAELWDNIMRSTYDYAEPGVLFIDTINKMNNLRYCETIAATNPCFTGQTKVWTIDGPVPFEELARSGRTVKVLTQLTDGKLAFRDMERPRLTGRKAKLLRVTLKGRGGNGKKGSITTVECTPGHLFFLTNGTAKRADQLCSRDSIISAYRHRANSRGYVGLVSGTDKVLEHQLVVESGTGDRPTWPSVHVHHLNEVKNDNSITNLVPMGGSAHLSSHKRGSMNPATRVDVRLKLCAAWTIERREALRQLVLGGQRFANNHRVVSVEPVEYEADVYCGTVPSTGRFFVSLGDENREGVLVSNCGEQPLPPFGACLLGSFNLVRYVRPGMFAVGGERCGAFSFDWTQLRADIPAVVRAMDNVVDRTRYPLEAQAQEAKSKRRMGLGVAGLANAGEALGLAYGSKEFIAFEVKVLEAIRDGAYVASAQLAGEKGAFPLYSPNEYLDGEFIATLPQEVVDEIGRFGIRNSHLTSCAPTGTISLAADNISSGIEPVFAYSFDRTEIREDGPHVERVEDYAVREWGIKGKRASEVTADEHVNVLVAASMCVDSAVSKTCNVPADVSWDSFKSIYMKAWEGGAKGCTTYRTGGKRGAVLVEKEKAEPAGAGQACFFDDNGQKHCG